MLKEYLNPILPYLETIPISKTELIMRFRSHCDTTKGRLKGLLNFVYMLSFRQIYRTNEGEIIIS